MGEGGKLREDWELLTGLLPGDWELLAEEAGALKGLRKDKSVEKLLRTLLLHVGCGHSLRETVVRAREGGLAELSDVGLLKRLRKSREWLQGMCVKLFREQGMLEGMEGEFQVRAVDATTVKEPGKSGSLWRLHYSVRLPSLTCDFFKLTEARGVGTGESLQRFPVEEGDYLIADRGYSRASDIGHVASSGGHVTVRVNTGALPLQTIRGKPLDLLSVVPSLKRVGMVGEWPTRIETPQGETVAGRVCAVRKTQEATRMAQKRLQKAAAKTGKRPQPETLAFAQYIILFTTFPENIFPTADVLEWYRIRWQVELVFKRFKSLAQLGHLPKYNDESAKAWLYGKMLVALLVEKLIHHATAVSPWGYHLETTSPS